MAEQGNSSGGDGSCWGIIQRLYVNSCNEILHDDIVDMDIYAKPSKISMFQKKYCNQEISPSKNMNLKCPNV